MIPIIQAQNITLSYLNKNFGLQNSDDKYFFSEAIGSLTDISELEKQYLDRVKSNYLSLLENSPLLEDAVKLVVLSPLLDLAGFYHAPFHISTEQSIEITEEIIIEAQAEIKEIIKGKIDVLVLQNQLWLLIVESKRSSFSLAKAIPQALTYMLANPNHNFTVYSLVMNGEDFQFIKLVKQNQPVYALSERFTLYRNENELYTVLKILKNIGEILN